MTSTLLPVLNSSIPFIKSTSFTNENIEASEKSNFTEPFTIQDLLSLAIFLPSNECISSLYLDIDIESDLNTTLSIPNSVVNLTGVEYIVYGNIIAFG